MRQKSVKTESQFEFLYHLLRASRHLLSIMDSGFELFPCGPSRVHHEPLSHRNLGCDVQKLKRHWFLFFFAFHFPSFFVGPNLTYNYYHLLLLFICVKRSKTGLNHWIWKLTGFISPLPFSRASLCRRSKHSGNETTLSRKHISFFCYFCAKIIWKWAPSLIDAFQMRRQK